MSMQPHSGAAQPEPKPATRDWTPTIAAVGMVMVFGLAALAVVKDNGGSITATSPWGGEISVTVLAPQ